MYISTCYVRHIAANLSHKIPADLKSCKFGLFFSKIKKNLNTLNVDQEYFQLFHHLPFSSVIIQNEQSSFLACAKWTKWGNRKGKKIAQMFIVTSNCSKTFYRMIEKCWTNHQIMFYIWNYTCTARVNYYKLTWTWIWHFALF